MKVLVTGATGKVGSRFLNKFLNEEKFSEATVRALCHNRLLKETERLEVISGSISDRGLVAEAMKGITHVIHLATCKETPEEVMDVTVKGMFWILEECRSAKSFEQFILIGGDAAMGHFFYPHPIPITETQEHSPYPGCYALSKVLEEVMLEQYYTQYNLNGCCLRAPWIMEKDDFKYSLSFGKDVFGGPIWRDFVSEDEAASYEETGTIPVMLDPEGQPVKRNFVHAEDLVSAIMLAIDHPNSRQELFNVCMDEPIDYGKVAEHLKRTRGLPSVEITTPYQSNWLDNAKAKFLLDWRPKIDLKQLVDKAWSYNRADDDPRKIWYPG
jgi:nucleoside-diphosphate-sugar epimerase